MRAMYGTFGREDIVLHRHDPPRCDPQGTSSQFSQRAVWQSRPGLGIPAFPGSRVIPTRGIDSREAAYRRKIQFCTSKVPKLTKTTLVKTEVHLFIQYIHQLLRQEAFDESVLENMIDTDTISLLQFIFYPIETHQRLPITTHWTVDWDVATMAEVQRDSIQKFVVLVRPSSTKCCVSNLFDIVNSRINDLSILLIY